MLNGWRFCIIFFLLLLHPIVQAKQVITIGVGNFPPFFVQKDESGLFLEITQAIFNNLPDYEVSFVFMSNSRLLYEINSGKRIDVACNIMKNADVHAYLSEPIFRYTDVVVSKKTKNFVFKSESDLQNVSIGAYQGAMDLLGDNFKKVAMSNPNYSEHPHPKETTHLLISEKKDVRIGDINIFMHDLKSRFYKDTDDGNIDNYDIHYLWPYKYSHMAFKDKTLRDAVNVEIKKLTLNGTLTNIYEQYQILSTIR